MTSKILYTAQVHTTGGRDGAAKSADGQLGVKLATPGTGRAGTNPEQLFAAGYSACFLGALKYVAAQKKVKIDEATTVTASVGIGPRADGGGFGLDIALSVAIPGVDRATAEELVAAADVVCPYSHLAHNGAKVALSVA